METPPQTRAEKIGKYGCLAMCYLKFANMVNDEHMTIGQYINCVSDMIDKDLLQEDCTVKDADKLLYALIGKKYRVTKKDITDIKDIKEPTPVQYYCKGYTPHWVLVKDGKIIFNSILNSSSVNKGQPVSARIIKEA